MLYYSDPRKGVEGRRMRIVSKPVKKAGGFFLPRSFVLGQMNNVKQCETKYISSRAPKESLCISKKDMFYFERDALRCCTLGVYKFKKVFKKSCCALVQITVCFYSCQRQMVLSNYTLFFLSSLWTQDSQEIRERQGKSSPRGGRQERGKQAGNFLHMRWVSWEPQRLRQLHQSRKQWLQQNMVSVLFPWRRTGNITVLITSGLWHTSATMYVIR